jgi:hypothetical protein
MRVKAIAGAMATTWEKLMTSVAPGRGHRKSFAPTTSIKLARNINSIPITPTHSRELLNPLVSLSSRLRHFFNFVPSLFLTDIPPP